MAECPKCANCGKRARTIIKVKETRLVWKDGDYEEETDVGYIQHAYCKGIVDQWQN